MDDSIREFAALDRLSLLIDVQYAIKLLRGAQSNAMDWRVADRIVRSLDALERAEEALQRRDEELAECTRYSADA